MAPDSAAAIVTGDPGGNAYTMETVNAMAWNICGEAGGDYAGSVDATGSSAYCPNRNSPGAKATAIALAAKGRDLNAIILEEVCGGPAHTALPEGSELDVIMEALGAEWDYAWAPAVRPGDTPIGDRRGSACRAGLTGMLGVAVLVKGKVTSRPEQFLMLPNPDPARHSTEPILCVNVAGWDNTICGVHVVNDSYTSETTSPTNYDKQITAIASFVANFPYVVLGGDFNTQNTAALAPLYSKMPECDQQAYYPGDPVNEVTQFSYRPRFGPNGSIVGGSYPSTKIDYLFATNGFGACSSLTGLADQADYSTTVQPGCLLTASPIVCTPTGVSDHAPIVGTVKGGPDAQWRLNDGSGTDAADASGRGNPGRLSTGVGFTDVHGGSATFNGSSGAVTASGPLVDTMSSFTVSAWANPDTGASTSTLVSQDGGYGGPSSNPIPNLASGFALYYNQPDASWRFSMPTGNARGASRDEAASQPGTARTGTWTKLTAAFDAVGGTKGNGGITLYVNGVKAATVNHTSVWPANGVFVAGRQLDPVTATPSRYWRGAIQDVNAYRYAMTPDAASANATKLMPPTKAMISPVPAAEAAKPGCDDLGRFAIVSSLTPRLQVTVLDPDPSKPVHANFSLWDNTVPGQLITLGGPGSASSSVVGGGVVSVVTPPLQPNHDYGWRAQTDDGATSPTTVNCHFKAPPA